MLFRSLAIASVLAVATYARFYLMMSTGERVIADPHLQIPHLELHHRRFALEPLCELRSELYHPVLGHRLSSLLLPLLSQDVVKLAPSELWDGRVREVS